MGRADWPFAGSLRACKRAAAVMSLIQSARLNELDPWVYLKNVIERLPTLRVAKVIYESLRDRGKRAAESDP
jgi:transposase